MNFGEAILSVRTSLRISQRELASMLGVSYATVNRWENGRTVPNKMTLTVIRQYCHANHLEFDYSWDTKQYVNTVFPGLSITDLRHDLIDRARAMAKGRTPNHPWQHLDDEQLLRSAGLILTDTATGREGITLAAILLFGPDTLILSALAHHKTDAIFRVFNTDRFDDRDVIITNLLESHDRLIEFGKKHLNDLFVMEGMQNISARDKILREIVSNSLAHRDYSNAYVAKLIIEKTRIVTENSNRSHGVGTLDPSSFEPFPKNPPISKVFREIGLADELGSGMRNTYKYTKLYSGSEPIFTEGDVFRIVIPLHESATATVGPSKVPRADTNPSDETLQRTILSMISDTPTITQSELSDQLGIALPKIKRTMAAMAKRQVLVRKGGKRHGFWEIKERNEQ